MGRTIRQQSHTSVSGQSFASASAGRSARKLLGPRVKEDLKSRSLRKPFGSSLYAWGYVVGLVISGEIFGWNITLDYGWYNLLIATVMTTVFYVFLVLIFAELSTAIPFADCLLVASSETLGDAFASFQAVMMIITYIMLVAQNLIALGGYTIMIFGIPNVLSEVVWLLIILVMLVVNRYTQFFYKFITVLTMYSIFSIFCLIFINFSGSIITNYTDSVPTLNSTIPVSINSLSFCVPAAIWWYLGAECSFTSSEEIDGYHKRPKLINLSIMITLATLSLVIVFVGPTFGSLSLITGSSQPFFDTLLFYLDVNATSLTGKLLLLVSVFPPVLASTVGGICCTSRKMYVLSRYGLIQRSLSITLNGSPVFAMMATCVLSFLMTVILQLFSLSSGQSSKEITRLLMMMPAWSGCVFWSTVCVSYVASRRKLGHLFKKSTILGYFYCTVSFILLISFFVFFLLSDQKVFYFICFGFTVVLYVVLALWIRFRRNLDFPKFTTIFLEESVNLKAERQLVKSLASLEN